MPKYGRLKPNLNIIELKFDNELIKPVKTVKFLGIYLDENLTWDYHIKYIRNKLSKNLFILKRVRHCLPTHSLRTLYYSYIHSVLVYGIAVWGPMALKSSVKHVKVLQNKAIRVVGGLKYNQNVSNTCKKLRMLTLDDMTELELCKIAYKFNNQSLPSSISNMFRPNSFQHHYNTRNRNNPRIERHHSKYFSNCYLVRAPALYMKLTNEIRAKYPIKVFVKSLKGIKLAI